MPCRNEMRCCAAIRRCPGPCALPCAVWRQSWWVWGRGRALRLCNRPRRHPCRTLSSLPESHHTLPHLPAPYPQLRRVPDPLMRVFSIGSTAPASLLYDALESFDKGSSKADETLRMVGPEMLTAVSECIEAAGHEFEPSTQKQLLRAAAFGHVYCPLDKRLPHHAFPGMCRTLRLLNALRQRDQGNMPVSHAQFQSMKPATILHRLVNAKRYLLAMRISEFLGESPHQIVLQWATAKMAASLQLSDRQLLDALMEKLSQVPGLPYNQVAQDAYGRGRPRLAALLLDFETRSSEQVPLLTSMGEDGRALQKAVESADMDLVYLAVFNMYRKIADFGAFAEAVNKHRPARDLFVAYTRRTARAAPLACFPLSRTIGPRHFHPLLLTPAASFVLLLGSSATVFVRQLSCVFCTRPCVANLGSSAEYPRNIPPNISAIAQDPDLLKSFFFATGDTEGTADAVFHDALYGPRDEGLLEPSLAAKLMQQAGDLYAKNTGAGAKDAAFHAGAAAAAAKLLRMQARAGGARRELSPNLPPRAHKRMTQGWLEAQGLGMHNAVLGVQSGFSLPLCALRVHPVLSLHLVVPASEPHVRPSATLCPSLRSWTWKRSPSVRASTRASPWRIQLQNASSLGTTRCAEMSSGAAEDETAGGELHARECG